MTAESAEEEASAKMLECSHCTKTFRYNSERIRHEMSHSPGFECEICCKKFSFVSALRRHQKQHERTGSVKCEECNRKFRDEVLLKRHIKYAHKGTFTCSKCNATFNSDQALRTHMKTHRPESERRFKCGFEGCGKSFNFSHHLKHHELTHTNAKQHYCSVCGKGFIQSHHLKTHLKTHDPSEWLYCDFSGCKKKFSTEYAKKRHMATHKVKPDSGISSDSNSCDASVSSKGNTEDFILCSSCGENVYQSSILSHSTRCGGILDISPNVEDCTKDTAKDGNFFHQTMFSPKPFQSLVKDEINYEEENTAVFDKNEGDCKSALGGCIMGNTDCVCADMTKPIEENHDFIPIIDSNNVAVVNENITENNNIEFIDYSEVVLNFFDNKENKAVLKKDNLIKESVPITTKQYDAKNICESCNCASTCNVKVPENCGGNKNIIARNDTSNVKTVGGVVKIKDTFDIDIPMKAEVKVESNDNKRYSEFIPFSTCKDIIGNCIAGGIEGCLCARMMIDEQQAMAQEIDDITPMPKTENYT